MKTPSRLSAALAVACLAALSGNAQAGPDCAAVGDRVSSAVAANPDQILTVVEDALIAYNECSCEIITAALQSSGADAALTEKIVFVAVKTAPTSAPSIAECAIAARPEQTDAIRKAFADAFNGSDVPEVTEVKPKPEPAKAEKKETGSASNATSGSSYYYDGGKEVAVYGGDAGGKEVYYDSLEMDYSKSPSPGLSYESSESVFGGAPLAMNQILLVPPVAASRPTVVEEVKVIKKVETKTVTKRIVVIPPPQVPQTPSSPTATSP